MKIIIAKRGGTDGSIAYINASRIDSFHTEENAYNGSLETKIYFDNGKCLIEGDKTQQIADFMASESDCGILDLTRDDKEKKTFWERK